MIKRFWISSIFLMLMGCNTVSSSYHYTMGTQAAQDGDLNTALVHLQQAVDLDPSMGRNHNNLAATYVNLGQIEKAWQPACQAVWALCDSETHRLATKTFIETWHWMREHHQIQKGLTIHEVLSRLGTPTSCDYFSNREGCVLTYGLLMLDIQGNVLISGQLIGSSEDQL